MGLRYRNLKQPVVKTPHNGVSSVNKKSRFSVAFSCHVSKSFALSSSPSSFYYVYHHH